MTAVLINVPYIQRALANTVAELVANTLHTKVEVGRIDLGLFNRIIIDNTTIYDQDGKPMVKAARLAVRIAPLELIEGRIRISSAQIFFPMSISAMSAILLNPRRPNLLESASTMVFCAVCIMA